ncbi:hypothetical protein GCM10009785_34370 [Brooklawnia cerclae]|uniref:DUF4272 domain-containing protein n=1 Tax=Brooklawnia cerclae TaxID=349934 RepID=A0ABX0SAG6_9ACTN|nr:DUF4272 domain-containing protein [Brooklawnia cerclae]NIH55397.1 hypothetical protein [Brooklawnia cerclae]
MLINAYSTRRGSCTHSFADPAERARWTAGDGPDQAFEDHLRDFEDYVEAAAAGSVTVGTDALLRHVRDVQRWYSFTIDADDPDQLSDLTSWAKQANAVLVIDGAVLDGRGRPLLPGPHGDASGEVPVVPEARERGERVRQWLASARSIPVPAAVPPVRAESEVVPRSAEAVGLRILALVLVSDFASSLAGGNPLDPEAMQWSFPQGFAAMSPAERDLFEQRDEQQALQLTWRIESALELLWAIDRTTLEWPSHSCTTDQVKQLVLSAGETAFLEELELRPVGELLDEYECLHSMGWALTEQQLYGGTVVPDTDGEVVAERLAAISWLTNGSLAWDDADTWDRLLQGPLA